MTFEDVTAGGAAWFDAALANQTQETLTLDFKVARVGQNGAQFTADGALNRDGRTTLSRALSAFSNSAGGLIVFGVDCRKNADNIDCAAALDPIPNLAAALSSLNAAIGDLMQPKHDGVRIAAIESAADRSIGYLVVDVPRSERRPHMCQMTRRYYKRAGTSSFEMEHYDVEDAFRREKSPDIELFHMFEGGLAVRGGSQARLTVHIPLMIKNVGPMSAKHVAVTLEPDRRGVNLVVDRNDRARGNRYSQYAGRTTIAAPLDFVVHPSEVREIDRLQFTFARGDDGRSRAGDMLLAEALAFQQLTLSAENMRPREFPIDLDNAEFDRLVREFDFR